MGIEDQILNTSVPIIGSPAISCSMCDEQVQREAIAANEGYCPVCQAEICIICGCSDERGCVKQCKGGVLTCEWQAPSVCSFCFQATAAEEYAAVNAKLFGPPEAYAARR